MADVLKIDPDDLTIGDLEDFEDITGQSFDQAFQANGNGTAHVSAKAIKAMVFLVKRRDDPSFTLDDARNVKIGALDIATKEDPTDAGG